MLIHNKTLVYLNGHHPPTSQLQLHSSCVIPHSSSFNLSLHLIALVKCTFNGDLTPHAQALIKTPTNKMITHVYKILLRASALSITLHYISSPTDELCCANALLQQEIYTVYIQYYNLAMNFDIDFERNYYIFRLPDCFE